MGALSAYRYDVTDLLAPGPHELTVDFTSAWSYTAAAAADQGGLQTRVRGQPAFDVEVVPVEGGCEVRIRAP